MIHTLTLTNLALISLIWVLPLKAISLWLSAREGKKIWFIALLIVQTMGILELVYLLIYVNTHTITAQKKSKSLKKPKSTGRSRTKKGKK